MFYARKIKGSIALFVGLIFIITGIKFIGVLLQLYGIYDFFKVYALKFMGYFEFIPIIGPYIKQFRAGTNIKKNDDDNKV